MTRIYENRGFTTRMNVSCVVVAFAFVFGFWEVWMAYRAGPDAGGTGYLFALFFIGGALYATKQLRDMGSDSVAALDADMATREAIVTLWRPVRTRRLTGPLDRLTDWQFQVKAGKARTPLLTAHHPAYPKPLEFELRRGVPVSDALRTLAPDAVAAFERPRGV
jgi:hypothetical protein